MSQYINFFILHEETNTFIPLISYSRNSDIYHVMNAPYEKVRLFRQSDLMKGAAEIESLRDAYLKRIEALNKTIDSICKMENNSIKEKLEQIYSEQLHIDELQEEVTYCEREAAELRFIAEIEGGPIYAGVEISNPTLENIV